MMGNDGFLISDIPTLDEQRSKKREPLEQIANRQLQIGIKNIAIDLICRDQSVTPDEAISMLAHYWMVSVGIDPLGENPLLNPAEYGAQESKTSRLQGAWQWLLSEG